MSQPRMVGGHHCMAAPAGPRITHQAHWSMKETSGMSRTGGENATKVSAGQTAVDCHLRKNCATETDKRKSSGPMLTTFTRQPLSSLQSRCKRLLVENASIQRQIMEIEDKAMKSATQQLQQYDRAGSIIRAVQSWTKHQIREAEKDLELMRKLGEERVNGLRLQLQDIEEQIQEIKIDLKQLRVYRDRGHSAKLLRAAELDRQLRALNEQHQDQAADVEALTQREIKHLLEIHRKEKDGTLQGVAEKHLDSAPLSLKRMSLQNQQMRSEIKAYQRLITVEFQDIVKLLETERSLCESRKEETDRQCRELLLLQPSCSADEDVVLDIPLTQSMLI
ncbi:hypothetical protein PRIEUP_LOCUS7198 [Pristimantis euphronides]